MREKFGFLRCKKLCLRLIYNTYQRVCRIRESIESNIICIKEDVNLRTQISPIYRSVISFSSQRPEKLRSFNMALFCPFFFILVVNSCWAATAQHGTHLFQNEKSQSSAKDSDMDKGGRSK